MWARVFALAYDPFLAAAERRGLANQRERLLSGLDGRVLEIGAGTGLNVEHYAAGADVTYTEPDPHMAARLRRHGVDVVEAVWLAATSGRSGECWFVQPGRDPAPFRFPNLPGPRADGEPVGPPPS